MRFLIIGLTLAAVAVGGLGAADASAAQCSKFSLAGSKYSLQVTGIGCAKGKRLAKRHVAFNEAPRGWTCKRDGQDTGSCKKRSSKQTYDRFSWRSADQVAG